VELRVRADDLPRRTAHAAHALLCATRELSMPATAAEVVLYDEEALSARCTGAALREAARRGLAVRAGRYWVPTFAAMEMRGILEERFLRDTEREGDE
jgi:hypothetical protein